MKTTLEQFKQEAIERGIKILLKETSHYDNFSVRLIYAEKAGNLVGCWGEKNGGKWFTRPLRAWSKTRRTFDKIKLN